MWPDILDLVIIYAVLTPASVLYWYTTDILLGTWVGGDSAKLLVGLISVVAIVSFHDVFRYTLTPLVIGGIVRPEINNF